METVDVDGAKHKAFCSTASGPRSDAQPRGVDSATKAALDALTRTFARELAPRRIRVNGVSPGLIATEGTHAVGFVQPGSEEVAGLGRVGKPEHIANGVLFLASDDSAWMNGENLVLTGGTF